MMEMKASLPISTAALSSPPLFRVLRRQQHEGLGDIAVDLSWFQRLASWRSQDRSQTLGAGV